MPSAHLSVILGLDPRTHRISKNELPMLQIRTSQWVLGSSPRMTESEDEGTRFRQNQLEYLH